MKKYFLTCIKYLFAVAVLILGCNTVHNFTYLAVSIFELALIILISDYLKKKNKGFQLVNNILVLLFNAQNLVLWFGNTYISLVMLQNVSSIRMLKGRIFAYALGVIAVIIISFLRIETFEFKNKISYIALPIALIIEVALILNLGFPYSPACGYISLARDYKEHKIMQEKLKAFAVEAYTVDVAPMEGRMTTTTSLEEEDASEILAEEISEIEELATVEDDSESFSIESVNQPNGSSSGFNLIGSNKNVILIFTEGLSKNVITDSRGIMPNMASFSNMTINFSNYYNHTFATYRGVQGQLFSGEQLENSSRNKFTSLMDVMREAGYYTVMINTEPVNPEWTDYLNHMGFDRVITDTNYDMIYDGDAYNKLFDTACELEGRGQKFFLVIYTMGTHASFDSDDVVYGDGNDAELNKFYNCDFHFGDFFNKYANSQLINDTVLTLTADHAAYQDQMFVDAFPGYNRVSISCDEIPFYIYNQGMTMNVDAKGRNSLDMAPTLLDVLGLQVPSTFLGGSLFYPKASEHTMDNYYWDSVEYYYTGNDRVEPLEKDVKECLQNVALRYCATCME